MTVPAVSAREQTTEWGDARELIAAFEEHDARQDPNDPLSLVWSARTIAPLLAALLAEVEQLREESTKFEADMYEHRNHVETLKGIITKRTAVVEQQTAALNDLLAVLERGLGVTAVANWPQVIAARAALRAGAEPGTSEP